MRFGAMLRRGDPGRVPEFQSVIDGSVNASMRIRVRRRTGEGRYRTPRHLWRHPPRRARKREDEGARAREPERIVSPFAAPKAAGYVLPVKAPSAAVRGMRCRSSPARSQRCVAFRALQPARPRSRRSIARSSCSATAALRPSVDRLSAEMRSLGIVHRVGPHRLLLPSPGTARDGHPRRGARRTRRLWCARAYRLRSGNDVQIFERQARQAGSERRLTSLLDFNWIIAGPKLFI